MEYKKLYYFLGYYNYLYYLCSVLIKKQCMNKKKTKSTIPKRLTPQEDDLISTIRLVQLHYGEMKEKMIALAYEYLDTLLFPEEEENN